jgi:hypothetical protein
VVTILKEMLEEHHAKALAFIKEFPSVPDLHEAPWQT